MPWIHRLDEMKQKKIGNEGNQKFESIWRVHVIDFRQDQMKVPSTTTSIPKAKQKNNCTTTFSDDKYKSEINFVIRMMEILINCGWPFFPCQWVYFSRVLNKMFVPRNSLYRKINTHNFRMMGVCVSTIWAKVKKFVPHFHLLNNLFDEILGIECVCVSEGEWCFIVLCPVIIWFGLY